MQLVQATDAWLAQVTAVWLAELEQETVASFLRLLRLLRLHLHHTNQKTIHGSDW